MSLGVDLYNTAEKVYAENKQKILNSTSFSEVTEKLKEAAEQGQYSCEFSADYIENLFGEDIASSYEFVNAWRSVGIDVIQRFVYGKEAYVFDWGIE